MKRVAVLTLALAAICGVAYAQSFTTSTSGVARSTLAPCVLGTEDITQNLDCEIVPITGIACSGGGIDAGNQYLRRFELTAGHGIVTPYTVEGVQFGGETTDPGGSACAGVPVTMNTYSIPIGAAFLYANMVLLDSVTLDLTGTAGTLVSFPVAGTVDPLTDDLVVEAVTCDSSNQGDFGSMFPGANSAGQTGLTYIASASCGIFEPTDLGSIGFPDSHNVFVVEGLEDGGGCQASFRGEPRMRRRSSGLSIEFNLDITHMRAEVIVPVYVELQDMAGNVIVSRDLGEVTLGNGETVSLRSMLNAPSSLEAGEYVLVGRIPRMKKLITFKKMIDVE